MRRLLLLGVAAIALAAGVAFTTGGSGLQAAPRAQSAGSGPTVPVAHRDGSRGAASHQTPRRQGRLHRMVVRAVLGSLAERLGVPRADLRRAVQAAMRQQRRAFFARAGLTRAEKRALRACARSMRGRRSGMHPKRSGDARGSLRSGRGQARCDRAAARSALRKLRRAPKPDLAQVKDQALTTIAGRLGISEARLAGAVRAELQQRLGQARAFGLITERGAELALACFDAPASCDVAELRAEMRRRHSAAEPQTRSS